jgi:hypothetical protein
VGWLILPVVCLLIAAFGWCGGYVVGWLAGFTAGRSYAQEKR